MQLRKNLIAGLFIAGALTGCAGDRYHREGLNKLAEGKAEEGLANLELAVKEEPDNAQFRADLIRRRGELINTFLANADAGRIDGKLDSSETLYKRVLQIESGNSRALAGLSAIERDRRHLALTDKARDLLKKGEVERTVGLLRQVLSENPANRDAIALMRQVEETQGKASIAEQALRTEHQKPISLEFRDANLKIVFEALARSTGVDFILDKDVRPDLRTTVFLRQSSLEDAINLILQTNRLEKKVLSPNAILIYPSTPEKLKDYQELVVKGFYLANADVKQTQAMIKGLLKTKDVFIDEKLNLLVMRDTPESIRLAEKLIAMHDLSEPEVMLEVEVLEVQRSRLMELGVQWPSQFTLTPLGTNGTTTLTDLKTLNSDRISVSVPNVVANLRREVGDVNILANPRIRARNREKAKIMIGDKVPVVTSTTTATGVISENVQYLDVGLKLDVEPNIYLKDEVAIKVGLEVSSLVREVRTPGGSLAYQIGSRSANTVLRLKDGETQVLAGLINDEDRMASSRVPGIGDIPLLGRLFSSQKDDRQKTEIVLSITPHLIRNIERPDASSSEFWSGTESALRTQPLQLQGPQSSKGNGNTAMADAANAPGMPADGNRQPGGRPEAVSEPTKIVLTWNGPNQVKVGEEFKVGLKMSADGGVRSLPFQAGFDPAAFQVLNIAEGSFFKQNDEKASLSSNIDSASGKAFVSVVQSGSNGTKGEGDVAIFTLRALSAKPGAEIKLLSSSPLVVGNKSLAPVPPAPLVINVVN